MYNTKIYYAQIMAETKITKQKLKEILNQISFPTDQKRQDWLNLVDYMNEQELKEAYDHFKERQEKDKEIKLKMIVKYDLDKTYEKGIGKLSDIFINKAKEKENKNKK